MENSNAIETLKQKNLNLRQERLLYYNLLSIVTDEIFVLKNYKKPKTNLQPTSETYEYYETLKKTHEELIEYCCECLQKETSMIENGGGEDVKLYILELEQILKQKMKSCEFLLNIARGLRLSYN
jgi:hypothetical protein